MKRPLLTNGLRILLGSVALIGQSALAQTYHYYVTEMPVAGSYNESGAYALNRDGSVVGLVIAGSQSQAFVWKPTSNNSRFGSQVLLGQLAGGASAGASSISDNDKIAGYAADASGTRFLTTWNYDTGLPTPLLTVTGFAGLGLGINDAGQIAYNNDGAPWIYQNGSGSLLACSWGSATAINQAGDIVGGANNGLLGSYQGTLWDSGNYGVSQNVGMLFGPDFRDSGSLYAINSQRRCTGYVIYGGAPQAFLWDIGNGGPVFIGPNAAHSSGYGINEQGDIVGAYTNNGQSGKPFLFENGTFHDLQSEIDPLSGWYLLWAFDVNEYGQIVGFGYLNGQPRGYLLTPVPVVHPPVANAGPDQALGCCSTATLDGSESSDPDGDALSYDWYDGSTHISSDVSFSAHLSAGVHTLTLVVTDPSNLTSSDTVMVTVEGMGFDGFFPPIGGADSTGGSFANPLRAFKLGSTIPIKFKGTCCGTTVLTGIHTLQATKYSNSVDSDPPIDATPTDAATTGNQFRLTGDQWHFNMSTVGLSSGTWKLTATLSDSSRHFVWITIKP